MSAAEVREPREGYRLYRMPIIRAPKHGFEALTPRELEVLAAYTVVGGGQKMVAAQLGCSLQTVKNHVSSILKKLDVESTMAAVLAYDRWVRSELPTWPEVERRSGRERRTHSDRRAGVDRRQA